MQMNFKIGRLHVLLKKNFEAIKTKFQQLIRSTRNAGTLVSVAWSQVVAIGMGMLTTACLQPAYVQAPAAFVFVLVVASFPIALKTNSLPRTSLWRTTLWQINAFAFALLGR